MYNILYYEELRTEFKPYGFNIEKGLKKWCEFHSLVRKYIIT